MALLPEALLAQSMTGSAPERDGNHDIAWAPHAIYRCAGDDRWVSIAVADDGEWRRLADVVDPGLASDPRFATTALRKQNEDALDAAIGAWCATRSPEDVRDVLQGVFVAAFPAMNAKDLHDDPHLGSRRYFVELPHPEIGVRRHMGIPYKLHRTPLAVWRAAPCLGEDTDYVLREVLGYDDARIDALRDTGALS